MGLNNAREYLFAYFSNTCNISKESFKILAALKTIILGNVNKKRNPKFP